MGGLSNAFTSQYEVYLKQYQSQAQTILKGAKAQFRDSTTLDAQLSQLEALFKDADKLVAQAESEKGKLSSSEKTQVKLLAGKLEAQIKAVVALFPHIEDADIQYIQSAKVATLDQPALKGLAAKLKDADKAFCKNLETLIPSDDGSDSDEPEWDIHPMDADGENAPNIPEPDEE